MPTARVATATTPRHAQNCVRTRYCREALLGQNPDDITLQVNACVLMGRLRPPFCGGVCDSSPYHNRVRPRYCATQSPKLPPKTDRLAAAIPGSGRSIVIRRPRWRGLPPGSGILRRNLRNLPGNPTLGSLTLAAQSAYDHFVRSGAPQRNPQAGSAPRFSSTTFYPAGSWRGSTHVDGLLCRQWDVDGVAMDLFVLLACPGCTFGNPVFFGLSMFAGTVPVAYLLLRPYTRNIRIWGIPRIDAARLGSLLMMLACLLPLWFIGRQENSATYVTACLGGLTTCCVYLWVRSCWLLESHHVTSTNRELLFPGLLVPAILVLGTIFGNWVLGILLFTFWWPMMLVPHTILSAVICLPIWWLVLAGLNYTFPKPEMISSSNLGDAAAPVRPVLPEQADRGETK